MKRVIIWVDSKSDKVEEVREKLKKFLSSMGLRYTIVEVSEIMEPEDSK